MKTSTTLTARLIGAALLAGLSMAGHAQNFPTKAVRVILPQNTGGSSDGMVRAIATKLTEKWGQPVVVEYKAGAGGNIGAAYVAQQPADGYTLLMGYLATQSVNGALYKKLPYDPERDFDAVAAVANTSIMVVVNKKVPASNMKELLALARKKPQRYSTSGNGSLNHLMGEMVNNATGVKMEHIPYKGIAQALTDTIGGQVEVCYIGVPAVVNQLKAGMVRAIAVSSEKRVETVGDVPTMAEAGYKDLSFEPWFGLFAPAGTPSQVVQKINHDVNEVLQSKEVVDQFHAVGVSPLSMSQPAFQALVKADTVKWGAIVRASGIKND